MGAGFHKAKEMNNSAMESFYAREDQQLEDRFVTYVIELEGKVLVVEHVPARVNRETGEQFFSVETMNRLQQLTE